MLRNLSLRKTGKLPFIGQRRLVSLVTFAVHCLNLPFLQSKCTVVIYMVSLWPMRIDSKGFFQQYEPIFCSALSWGTVSSGLPTTIVYGRKFRKWVHLTSVVRACYLWLKTTHTATYYSDLFHSAHHVFKRVSLTELSADRKRAAHLGRALSPSRSVKRVMVGRGALPSQW